MNLLLGLSARHLRLNKKRTAITIIGIALSIAMVTAISGFIVSFQDLLFHDAINRDGPWHVAFYGIDRETAEAAAEDPLFSGHTFAEEEDGTTVFLEVKKPDRHIFDYADGVRVKHGIGENQIRFHNNLLIALGLVPAGYYGPLYTFAAILLTLVGVASIMVIGNAFSISAAERSRQFGLLKSVGATSRQIRGTVLCEGVVLGAFAIPLGILIGLGAEWVALTIANNILGGMDAVNFMADFRVVVSPWVLLIAVAAAFLTIFLAAWIPARKAAHLSAIDAIRQTADIRVRPGDVRVFPLTGRLFGFEGLLAAKTMKRNRGRYRTTVISLTVSIVLFIAVSSFGDMLMRASVMVYEDYGTNFMARIHGEDREKQNWLGTELAAIEGVTAAYPFRELQAAASIPEDWMTEQGLEMLEAGEKRVTLYSLSDEDFAAVCRSAGVPASAFGPEEPPGGILINTSGTYISHGRRHNFVPYRRLTDRSLPLTTDDGIPHELAILGETENIPTAVNLFFSAKALNFIVPESLLFQWLPEGESSYLTVMFMSPDPDNLAVQAEDFLTREHKGYTFQIHNYEALAENNRNIYTLIMIFIYGFIAMLSLIGITNVVTTVSTGIALRRRELATLRSVGMTHRAINKSLYYESLIFGLKSLVLGILFGTAASYAMYIALEGAMSFPYRWPVTSALISIVAVFLITIVTMRLASNKQQRESIVGVLQSEIT